MTTNEMTTLANLKLVAATKPTALAPIVQRRNKLIKRLHEQIELTTALAEGRDYVVTRLRTVIDDETKITKTVRQSMLSNGAVNLSCFNNLLKTMR